MELGGSSIWESDYVSTANIQPVFWKRVQNSWSFFFLLFKSRDGKKKENVLQDGAATDRKNHDPPQPPPQPAEWINPRGRSVLGPLPPPGLWSLPVIFGRSKVKIQQEIQTITSIYGGLGGVSADLLLASFPWMFRSPMQTHSSSPATCPQDLRIDGISAVN